MVAKGVLTNVKKNHYHVKLDSKMLVEIHDPLLCPVYFGKLIVIGIRQDKVEETVDSILVKEGRVFFCSSVPVVLFDTPGISRCRSQHVSVESSSLIHHSIYL